MNKYFNNAILGNSSILVTENDKGQLLRFFAPNIDYFQHIDEHKTYLILNENKLLDLQDESIFKYIQYYEKDTNIFVTEIYNEDIKLKQTDYVDVSRDVLVRRYVIEGVFSSASLIVHSKLISNEVDFISGMYNEDVEGLIQYSKDSYFTTFSDVKPLTYQINCAAEAIKSLTFNQKDYVGMSHDSAIVYSFDARKSLNIYMAFRDSLFMTKKIVERVRKLGEKELYSDTLEYWNIAVSRLKTYSEINENEKRTYLRSFLLFPLYINDKTGGIIAGAESDEKMTKSGGYGFSWPRDNMYITKALNICGLSKISEYYYRNFCRITQLENGMWEQRYYTDGNIAPMWGMQIDETASCVIGIIEQYKLNKDDSYITVLKETLDKAVEFLLKSIDSETNLHNKCYDLWEMFEDSHLYTLASIYYAFKLYTENIKDCKNLNLISIKMQKIKKEMYIKYYDKDKKYFKRNTQDDIIDISVLGLVWPFNMYDAMDEHILNTVEHIENKLTSPVGGIYRFENDTYMDSNPWVIATLWLTLFYMKKYKTTNDIADYNKALAYFNWVSDHSDQHGFLAEQISKETNKPLWINGLAWSHAMYIVCLEEIYGEK